MSLRAVGEGHISSIEFRSGVIDGAGDLTFDPLGPQLVTGERAPPASYDKAQFRAKLAELGAGNELAWGVLDPLPEPFSAAELEQSLAALDARRAAARHQLRDRQDHAGARLVELRDQLPRRLGRCRSG